MREKTLRGAVIPAIVLLAWLGVSCGGEPEAPEPVPAPEASERAAPPEPATSPAPVPVRPAPPLAARREPIVESRLIPGAPMPSSFPQDLPVPEGAALVGAFDGGAANSMVAWEIDGSPEALVREMKDRYERGGWLVTMAEMDGDEGLVFAIKGPRAVMTTIRAAGSGRATIETISLLEPPQ